MSYNIAASSKFLLGTLTKSTTLYNTVTQQKERISKLLLCYAAEQREVESLPFGSVGVVLGLKFTRTGDTLVSPQPARASPKGSVVGSITPPPATISAAVVSQSQSDLQSVQQAIASLARTDPSVRWSVEDGQTLVHGLGALHLEIVEGRLKDEFNANCSLGQRRVSYKETFPEIPEVSKELHWDKEVMGKPAKATIELSVRRLEDSEAGSEEWDGNVVLDASGNTLPISSFDLSKVNPEIIAVVQGIQGPLSASPHALLPMTKTCVTVKKYSLAQGSPPAALASAATMLLRQIFQEVGGGDILEPFINVKVAVPEGFMGKVVKDLTEHGGVIHEMETDNSTLSSIGSAQGEETVPFSSEGLFIPPSWVTPSALTNSGDGDAVSRQKRTIYAIAPLSKMLDYQSRLRAVSGGQATFEMSSAGFKQVDHQRKIEILRELGRA
jgi:elongation factor G